VTKSKVKIKRLHQGNLLLAKYDFSIPSSKDFPLTYKTHYISRTVEDGVKTKAAFVGIGAGVEC